MKNTNKDDSTLLGILAISLIVMNVPTLLENVIDLSAHNFVTGLISGLFTGLRILGVGLLAYSIFGIIKNKKSQ